MSRVISKMRDWLTSFARAREGNVAMMAGIALPVLLLMSAGAVDMHNFLRVKSELQDALDAAALAAARSPYTDAVNIQNVGMASMEANMANYFKPKLDGSVATFTLGGKDKVVGTATVNVKTLIANTFLPPYGKIFDDYLPVSVDTEVMRASRNVEVAIALDITYSMNQDMTALKSAAKELIGIVVQTEQSPYTSRVALVPYSAAVNMGSTYASKMRGTLAGATNISTLEWATAGRATVANSSVTLGGTNGNRTITMTSSGHGFTNTSNQWAVVTYGSGSSARELAVPVTYVSNTQITVPYAFNSRQSGSHYFQKCKYESCRARIATDGAHGLSNGELILVSNQTNTLGSNSVIAPVYSSTANELYISPTDWGTTASASGGTVACGRDGCATRVYEAYAGGYKTLPSTNCVSERAWVSNAPSEATPATGSWLGRAYMQTSGHYSCPAAEVMPLTHVKSSLESRINSMSANGTTAGQIGIENAWYMLSPNFEDIYSTGKPNPYNPAETIKAAVIMTDGEFNTPYCDGVARRMNPVDSTANSVLRDWYIDCAAGNLPAADIFKRSVDVCNAMKAKGIVIYTVGFNLDSSTGGAGIDTAVEVMRECATSAENFHFTTGGTNLQDAFRAIGRDITRLRIAR